MNTLLSPWIVMPIVLVCMLIVSAHVTIIQHTPAPRFRRRVRVCNGWVMLVILPMLGAGVSLVSSTTHPRLFALTWLMIIMLLVLAIVLAVVDTAYTVRLAGRERRQLRAELYDPEGIDD